VQQSLAPEVAARILHVQQVADLNSSRDIVLVIDGQAKPSLISSPAK
jgi:hypothetical protein